MKKYLLILIIAFICFSNNVFAASYEMKLETNSLEVEKDSTIDVYITLKNISGITDGLNVCETTITNDSTIKINSITGQSNWNATNGAKLVMDSSSGVLNNMSIAKLNVTISDKGTLSLNNINCTDGTNEYAADSNTLSFTLKQVQQDNINNNNNNSNNNGNYNSSDTVEPSETGIKELTIVFILFAILSLIIKKVVSKKDLFKKI